MGLHDLIVQSPVIFLVVRGHAVRTARRFPLEQMLASLAEHVFLEDGRRKLVKHLPNPRPLGTLGRSLWNYGDCDRCAVARAERSGSVDTFFLFFFFSHTFAFQLLDKPWSQVSSLLLPGSCLQFVSRIGFSNPTARRFFIEFCYLTLSRFPQVNLCTRKSPTELELVRTRRGSNSRN